MFNMQFFGKFFQKQKKLLKKDEVKFVDKFPPYSELNIDNLVKYGREKLGSEFFMYLPDYVKTTELKRFYIINVKMNFQ